MTDVKNNNELMSHDEAFTFLQDKYDTLVAEVEYWLYETNLPRYNAEGEAFTDDQASFFDRKIIKETDFEKEYPRYTKIPFYEVKGNIINGMKASSIIRKQLEKVKCVEYYYTVCEMLTSLTAFINNIPNKNNQLIVARNQYAGYTHLYYSKTEVKALNVTEPKHLYIDFNILMGRPFWKGLDETEVILDLMNKCDHKRLKVIGHDRYIPCAMNGSEDFMEDSDGERIFTGHYGYDAKQLIGSKQAIFQLSEIIELEKALDFSTPDEESDKKESLENLISKTVNQLFEVELDKLRNRQASMPKNKNCIVERILAADEKGTQLLKNNKTSAARVLRLLSDLDYKNKIALIKTTSKKNLV